tara:strand:+ start:5438 stop:6595 length:1158 start_codon:yes stop_codon:yes gene_type:complete
MASITGMKTGSFTDINLQGPLRVGDTLNPGAVGQVLISNGENEATEWGTNSAVVPNALTAGTNITYTSGSATWDGAIADTINATDTDTTYSAGNGIDLTGTTFSTDNDGTTINNTGGTGTQNQVLKVPNALTAGTGIQLVGGSGPVASYSGDDATTINSTITDTTYQGGDNITIDTTTNPDTIDLDKTITDQTSIQFNNTGTTTSIIGSSYYMAPRTTCTYLDLESSTNLILPPNVFDMAGTYVMAFNQGVFMPNDDSSYYNYAIEDDFTAPLVAGRGKIMTSGLELEAFLNIPNGWRATGILIDLRGSTGYKVSRSITLYEVKTWSAANPISSTYTYLGGTTTNTQYTFATTMDGSYDNSLWIEVSMSSTSDYIAGGYIILTKL